MTNIKKGFVPIIVVAIVAVVLASGYYFSGRRSSPIQTKNTESADKTSESKPASGKYDISGEWDHTSKISGVSKSGKMSFVGTEIYFNMMAARYSLNADIVKFSVYGGLSYEGKMSSADYMKGTVTKDGKEIGTWDAKRPDGTGGGSIGTQETNTSSENIPGNVYDAGGNWDFEALKLEMETKTILLFEGTKNDGMFTNGDSLSGKYSVANNAINMKLAGGTEYAGNFTDQDNMNGKVLYNGFPVGTWSAKKRNDVKFDIRDNWEVTATNAFPVGSKPFKYEVIIGYMKRVSSTPPSMTSGKVANASDAQNVLDYKVSWPDGSVTWTTWDGSITYSGNFVNENLIKGEFKGKGLSSDARGVWMAERITN